MPETYKTHLGLYLQNKGQLNVSTFCSGTDSPINVMNALSTAAGDFFKLQLTVSHELSVEKDVYKQRFLLNMLGEDMKMLVEDR